MFAEAEGRLILKLVLCAMLVPLVLAGCDTVEESFIVESVESHRNYARALTLHGLDETSAGERWLEASTRPFSGTKRTLTPFTEMVTLDPLSAPVVAYEFAATLGQRIDISIGTELTGFFVDLFFVEGEQSGRLVSTNPRVPDPLLSWQTDEGELSFEPRESGWYLLRIQPRLFEGGQVTVTVAADASLVWPVPGTDRRRVWSFFGDSRGTRVHHGVDIFASRGTPLVAVSQSTVHRVGERDLGGNIVTLHDDEREIRIYYAHLDEQLTTEGHAVAPGEVIGTVGNSGNAITTPPHLHIGIYQTNWRRPVDPWYFFVPPNREPEPIWNPQYEADSWLRTTSAGVVPVQYPAARSGVVQSPARFDASGSPIRAEDIAPSRLAGGAPVTHPLPAGTPLRLNGATRGYYRVELPTGEAGYVLRTEVAAADRPVRSLQTAQPVDVFFAPDSTSDVVSRFPSGSTVEVFGVYAGRYGLVFRGNGHAGWIELSEESSG